MSLFFWSATRKNFNILVKVNMIKLPGTYMEGNTVNPSRTSPGISLMFADVNRKNVCVPLITYLWVQIDFQLIEHVYVTEVWKRMTRQTSYQPQ